MMRSLLGSRLIKTIDTVPFTTESSDIIVTTLQEAGFVTVDNGHHIAVGVTRLAQTLDWECAVIYQCETSLWVKVLAKRWWLLFTAGDRDGQYEALWKAIDLLQPEFDKLQRSGWKIHQGTVGELNATQIFIEAVGRMPTPQELADLKAEMGKAIGEVL